eukprot:751839-Hanusia_phi.AAC.6
MVVGRDAGVLTLARYSSSRALNEVDDMDTYVQTVTGLKTGSRCVDTDDAVSASHDASPILLIVAVGGTKRNRSRKCGQEQEQELSRAGAGGRCEWRAYSRSLSSSFWV